MTKSTNWQMELLSCFLCTAPQLPEEGKVYHDSSTVTKSEHCLKMYLAEYSVEWASFQNRPGQLAWSRVKLPETIQANTGHMLSVVLAAAQDISK